MLPARFQILSNILAATGMLEWQFSGSDGLFLLIYSLLGCLASQIGYLVLSRKMGNLKLKSELSDA